MRQCEGTQVMVGSETRKEPTGRQPRFFLCGVGTASPTKLSEPVRVRWGGPLNPEWGTRVVSHQERGVEETETDLSPNSYILILCAVALRAAVGAAWSTLASSFP